MNENQACLFPLEPASLRDLSFAVVDLETTGGTPKGGWNRENRFIPASEITDVGVVFLAGPVVQGRWESLCAIERELPRGIQRLTGITLQMLSAAPAWEQVALSLAPQLEGRIWVAHHAPFDGTFLRALLPEGLWKRHTLICSCKLARELIPEAKSCSLANLCGLLQLRNSRPHRALPDAEATAELLQILLQRAEDKGMSADVFLEIGRVGWEKLK